MAETKQVIENDDQQVVVDRARDFWSRYSRPVLIASAAIIVLCGGYLAYKYAIQRPQEEKALESMFKAEEYYRMDSLNAALNGDGVNAGFLKVIDKSGGTPAGNLARFYAGSIYLKQGNPANAAKYLADFKTDAKQIQARAYKLLGDAYAEQGKNSDALDAYKKAAHHFEDDDVNSSEYLFLAAYFAARVANNQKEAVDLFKELKDKFPRTEKGFEAEKYLAQLGVYSDSK
ncbi:tetratricopeptide repeat protein [Paraflavisolibacter sp. H34]|uniref:tetratricopeptide repeat protein n=1 Tax=Huijunlia imazamoxiresistens TaxID=3127457 RepID=UPI00301A53CA